MTRQLQPVYALLGYAGLIPFVVPAMLVATGSAHTNLAIDIGEIYAFAIIAFLTGSWWGLALRSGRTRPLLLSNLFFLLALFIYLFASQWWSLAAAILLASLFFAENSEPMFPDLAPSYRKMRAVLTTVASGSTLILHLGG